MQAGSQLLQSMYWLSCYCFLIAIIIGTVATPLTTAIIVGSDFVINIYHGCRVWKLAKEKGKDDYKGLFLIFAFISLEIVIYVNLLEKMSLKFCLKILF